MGKARWVVLAGAVAIASLLGLARADKADAYTRIDASCGMVKVHPIIPYLHRWHVHIGYTANLRHKHRCVGQWRPVIGRSILGTPQTLGPWTLFRPAIATWNWAGAVDIGLDTAVTLGTCTTFSLALAGELPTFGSDTIVTTAAGAGCVKGAIAVKGDIDTVFPVKK